MSERNLVVVLVRDIETDQGKKGKEREKIGPFYITGNCIFLLIMLNEWGECCGGVCSTIYYKELGKESKVKEWKNWRVLDYWLLHFLIDYVVWMKGTLWRCVYVILKGIRKEKASKEGKSLTLSRSLAVVFYYCLCYMSEGECCGGVCSARY